MNISLMHAPLSSNSHHKINASQIHYFSYTAIQPTRPIHNFATKRNTFN